MEKQLCVWIDGDLKDALTERAQRDKTTLREIVAEILQLDISRERGELVQQQALPILRELIQTEVRNGFAQFRLDVREDLHVEMVDEMRDIVKTSESRLARLIIRVARDTSILHHFLSTFVARLVDGGFAYDAYEDAKEKAAQEFAVRSSLKKIATQ